MFLTLEGLGVPTVKGLLACMVEGLFWGALFFSCSLCLFPFTLVLLLYLYCWTWIPRCALLLAFLPGLERWRFGCVVSVHTTHSVLEALETLYQTICASHTVVDPLGVADASVPRTLRRLSFSSATQRCWVE